MLLSVVPGLLAAGAILYAIRQIPRPKTRERQPLRSAVCQAPFEVGVDPSALLIQQSRAAAAGAWIPLRGIA